MGGIPDAVMGDAPARHRADSPLADRGQHAIVAVGRDPPDLVVVRGMVLRPDAASQSR